MSDENEEPGFIDHIFNMFTAIGKAQSKSNAERDTGRATKGKRKMKVVAFDEAPATAEPKECCTAKRGE